MAFSILRTPRAHTTLTYRSPEGIAFANLTKPISRAVSNSGVKSGFALIKNRGRGSSLLVQEAEQQVEEDLLARLKRYEAQKNWPSLFQTYQALPIIGGELKLGPYQSILVMLMDDEQTPNISVIPVPGRLETIAIDTGKFGNPVYESNRSDYIHRGSERIFDITGMLARNSRVLNDAFLDGASVYAGTGNTTCVLYHDTNREGVEGIVKRMDAFAPAALPLSAYRHNDFEKRFNIPPDERQNGRAHVLCGAMLQSSVIFPSSAPKGKIYLVELDGPRKGRQLHICVAEGVLAKDLLKPIE